VLGFGFLFRLTDESIEKHKNERPRRLLSESSTVDVRNNKSDNAEIEDEELQVEEDGSEFPDTQVKINLDSSSNRVRTQTQSSMSVSSVNTFLSESVNNETDESQNTVIISSGVAPISVSAQKLRKDKKKADKKAQNEGPKPNAKEEKVEPQDKQDDQDKDSQVQKPKRGQHGRNKKIKEKYRFQDEEERAQRMLLLQGKGGDGTNVGGKKGKGKNSSNVVPSPIKQKLAAREVKEVIPPNPPAVTAEDKNDTEVLPPPPNPEVIPGEQKEEVDPHPVPNESEGKTEQKELPVEEEPEEEEEEGNQEAEKNLLNSLTGAPQEEDELLFAVPVVAPYSTLQNYKFKIKMVPGSAKRGKAARSALEFFLRDKSANQREKDLLKSVKDQDLARNFPGKVKISTSHDKR
jgi:hypothetical protein